MGMEPCDCFGPNVQVVSIFMLIYQEIAPVTYYHHVTHKKIFFFLMIRKQIRINSE